MNFQSLSLQFLVRWLTGKWIFFYFFPLCVLICFYPEVLFRKNLYFDILHFLFLKLFTFFYFYIKIFHRTIFWISLSFFIWVDLCVEFIILSIINPYFDYLLIIRIILILIIIITSVNPSYYNFYLRYNIMS